MSAEDIVNPHEFVRDVDVENAAVKFLGLHPEKVKRTLLSELTNSVKRFVTHGDATDCLEPRSRESRRRGVEHTITEEDEAFLTASEINNDDLLVVSGGIRMALAEVPEEPDLKGLELLTVKLNVSTMCKQKDGLYTLSLHVQNVLKIANELETSISRKKELIALHSEVFDEDDLIITRESIQLDAKQLLIISNWVSAVLDDLSILIRERQNIQLKFTNIAGGNKVKISEQMQIKTLKMKSLHHALLARLDCLQIPRFDHKGSSLGKLDAKRPGPE